ncbi:MAG: peroxide stress protein YaaA [Micrococcales bacterium]|nr:peroxide stress protein YaaA [Micrococcales bacterium]NBR54625.1 peroxide stress protein YaaA [Micrococcales bacterium]NBR60977.1 peroxide stress protein YaaA [Actinomycetota bacterium]NBT46579.1 peroxide stress protein YaaA [Actinomycetota bacterium]NBY44222.1 peroxide stress protein YaaA [Micrococcales bacterium]
MVLILLPPSETKRIGGQNLTISQVHLSYGQLDPARDQVLTALLELCSDANEAAKVLKLSPKQLEDISRNFELPKAPTMPAYLRYAGTLYKAIGVESFTEHEVERMRSKVLMQSALFGLISATDRIPWYRLSADTKLPGIDLKAIWRENQPMAWGRLVDLPIIDMRSKSYADLAPVPETIDSYWVEVVSEVDGERRALNHFNKTAKGELVAAFVRAKRTPESLAQLKKVAESVGLGMEVEGNVIYLVTSEVVRGKLF